MLNCNIEIALCLGHVPCQGLSPRNGKGNLSPEWTNRKGALIYQRKTLDICFAYMVDFLMV
jgi:hypothetical protein